MAVDEGSGNLTRNSYQAVIREVLRKTAVTDGVEMNACSLGRGKKGSVKYPVNFACVFANADAAQDIGLFQSDFYIVFSSKPSQAHFKARDFRYYMPSNNIGMSFPHVLFGSDPFKIICVVINLVSV